VTLSPYCIERHEVSVDDYQGCVSIGSCAPPPAGVEWEGITARERKIFSPLCNGNDKKRGQHPVNCVDWTMAEAYCSFHSKRLPTEAEWELAARGPQGRSFPWGNEAPTSAHVNGCGGERRADLGDALRGRRRLPGHGAGRFAPEGAFARGGRRSRRQRLGMDGRL
jgi:formylglycine-generating enzyme required for sulfatase activity